MIRDRLVFPHSLTNELRWSNMMKLVGVHTQKPISMPHLLACNVKHIRSQSRFRKEHGLFGERNNSFVLSGKLLNDFPRLVQTPGVENVNFIDPLKEMIEALTDDVGFVANWK